MKTTMLAFVLLAAALAACGTVSPTDPDARPLDATDTDATATPLDAGLDAAADAGFDAPPPPPGQESTGAAGRVRGATFTMDVQIGHPVGQHQIQGSTFRLEANTPIKP